MKYYLEITQQYFQSAKEVDEGQLTKNVVKSNELDFEPEEGVEYEVDNYDDDSPMTPVNKDEWYGSEDGYNREYETYTYTEITKEEYEKFQLIIDMYDQIGEEPDEPFMEEEVDNEQ